MTPLEMFNWTWSRFADEGHVGVLHGADYVRVLAQWDANGGVGEDAQMNDFAQFIQENADWYD